MEITFGNTVLRNFGSCGFVESIGVQSLVGDNMVLQKSLEILLAVFAEEEASDPRTELLECEIGWCEDCPAKVGRCIIDGFEKTGLREAKL